MPRHTAPTETPADVANHSADSGDDRQGIQSIEVGMRLLQVLSGAPRALMLRDLAQAAAMSPAKAHRYLVSFARMGLIEQDAVSGRYDLGPFALTMGLAALSRLDPVNLARPALAALRDTIDQTVALAVWGNRGPTIVMWLESSHAVTAHLRTGSVMPLLNSSTGRCFAAFLPPAQSASLLRAELATARHSDVPGLPKSAAAYEDILTQTRDHGLARVAGDLMPGIHALSAPVFGADGLPCLVLTALGHAGVFDSAWNGPVATALSDCARTLSHRLGFTTPQA